MHSPGVESGSSRAWRRGWGVKLPNESHVRLSVGLHHYVMSISIHSEMMELGDGELIDHFPNLLVFL